ncbi:MAG: hypothetical protein ACNI26_06205 [Terasakiella sp.]|uniref:hypothetical protein n=1 Tax=unclassified Terasakiella TaxID=2614952 RepID=UPI003B0036B8
MTHIDKFNDLLSQEDENVDLYLFGWFDNTGNTGDYGLNVPPAHKTFQTLVTTTYMFQSEPSFTLCCRPFKMSQAQFDYLQEHDLDTQEFLATLGPLPDITFALDLSQHKDVNSALDTIKDLSF